MSKNKVKNCSEKEFCWLTIPEVKCLICRLKEPFISDADIYRYALNNMITLSIYFPSPIILKKIKISNEKIQFKILTKTQFEQFCHLEPNQFIINKNYIYSTEDNPLFSTSHILDTSLTGYEYTLVQRLLAQSLDIPLPDTYNDQDNFGITLMIDGDIYQLFEKRSFEERYQHQLLSLAPNIASYLINDTSLNATCIFSHSALFPVYDLPKGACFVLRQSELDKLLNLRVNSSVSPEPLPRISTPLSRLFWLSCKNNDSISSLINKPYKLLPIFEQWAQEMGITDKLSGETLKSALERGSLLKK